MRLTGKEILVVDDSVDARAVLRRFLEGAGAVVSEAEGADQALEMARKRPPHLILLDLHMPGKDGLQCLGSLRAEELLRKTPILMLTASREKASVVRAIAGGANDYVVKPFESRILQQKLAKHLEAADFYRHTFAAADRPRAHLEIHGRIEAVGQGGLRVRVPLALGARSPVEVEAGLFEHVLGGRPTAFSVSPAATRSDGGSYIHWINMSGLTEALAQKFRAAIRDMDRRRDE